MKRHGKWQLHQHNLFVSEGFQADSLTAALPDPKSVQEVITTGHTREFTHDQLGFSVVDEPLDLLGPSHGSAPSSSVSQPSVLVDQPAVEVHDDDMETSAQPSSAVAAPAPFEAPIAHDEPVQPDDVAAGPDEIVLDGTRIDSSSSLAVIKAACESLGVSTHGSRLQLFKRLMSHLQQHELLAAHSVKHNLSKELQRQVNQPAVPAEPSEEEVREHNTTHIPYKDWCELCVAHKGRQD